MNSINIATIYDTQHNDIYCDTLNIINQTHVFANPYDIVCNMSYNDYQIVPSANIILLLINLNDSEKYTNVINLLSKHTKLHVIVHVNCLDVTNDDYIKLTEYDNHVATLKQIYNSNNVSFQPIRKLYNGTQNDISYVYGPSIKCAGHILLKLNLVNLCITITNIKLPTYVFTGHDDSGKSNLYDTLRMNNQHIDLFGTDCFVLAESDDIEKWNADICFYVLNGPLFDNDIERQQYDIEYLRQIINYKHTHPHVKIILIVNYCDNYISLHNTVAILKQTLDDNSIYAIDGCTKFNTNIFEAYTFVKYFYDDASDSHFNTFVLHLLKQTNSTYESKSYYNSFDELVADAKNIASVQKQIDDITNKNPIMCEWNRIYIGTLQDNAMRYDDYDNLYDIINSQIRN